MTHHLDFFETNFFRRPAGAPFSATFSLDTICVFWPNLIPLRCVVHFLWPSISKGLFSKDDFSYCLHIKAENVQMVITSDWMTLETSSLDHNTILIRETFPDVLVKIQHDDVT